MRGGLSAIQQTLTPEAASVLSHAIAEASRRNHGQTTPLHVAATLLASPTGFLRQACIRSHPNSSHPLQCRALELCFSVALEQLPTAQLNPGSGPASSGDPPVSNALMAALKRAQAHKRRGCPEQQPLLAVKVELEQLIISILDDPSVSRVMREASFSSPAVKAAIEQALNNQPNSGPAGPRIGLAFRPGPQPGSLGLGTIGLAAGAGIVPPSPVSGAGGRNLYLNPRLQQNNSQVNGWMVNREDEVKKVMDILLKSKKRNPVLVGEFEPEEVVKEVLRRFEKDETHDGVLKGVEIISVVRELGADQAQLGNKVKEFEALIERKMGKGEGGVIVDLGNLKWLVDQQGAKGVSEAARGAVSEMGRMLRKHGEGSRIWFIGTATCETYLRCQVYHPSMESDWDLQVLSIVSRPPHMPGMVPRLGTNGGILSTSVECLSPMKGYTMPGPPLTRRLSENFDPSRRFSFCPQCTEQYGQELARLEAEPADKPSKEVKIDAGRQSLPPWLQNAKLHTNDKGANDLAQGKDQESMILRQKTQELQIKWSETCLQLHPGFHHNVGSERIIPSPLSMTGLYNPSLLGRQPLQPKLQQPRSLGDALQLRTPVPSQVDLERLTSKPASPVRIDLALGPTKLTQATEDVVHKERLTDFLGCVSSESQSKVHEVPIVNRPSGQGDIDSFKRLLKGLTERVWWQTDAASAVASAITQCKLGNGKRRVGGSKGNIWLLFSGADRIGKKKMATALSELLCNVSPILIALGSRRNGDESDLDFRGKTAIDRITETVRRNPFSVIMLQDIDEADMLVRGSIKRAMERGRLTDSHGREISLGNVIFIVTASWMPDQLKGLSNGGLRLSEEKLISLASGGWQLKLSIGEKASVKRPPSWLDGDQGRATKQRKDLGLGLSFDLNQMADTDDERLNGSNNSSDLTVEHEEEHGYEPRGSPTTPSAAPNDLLTAVDETIIFKPVDFTPIKHNIERTILTTFSSILGDKLTVKVESEVLEKLLSGIWLGQTAIESWAEKVLISSIQQLKATLPSLFAHSPDREVVARLEVYQEVGSRDPGDWLPSRIAVVADAQ